MAPLAVGHALRSRSPFKLPPPPQTAAAVEGLVQLRILVYVLLGTSAVFGLAVLLWKLGVLLRHFTIGRILRDRKLMETRYIKTWYGWIPQDDYNSRKQIWKNLCWKFRNWFVWREDNDDFSKIWWDSPFAKEEKHHIDDLKELPRSNYLPKYRPNRILSEYPKSDRIIPVRITATNHVLTIPSALDIYHSQSRTSIYLTFPFCSKSAVPVSTANKNLACFAEKNDSTLNKSLNLFLDMQDKSSTDFKESICRQPKHPSLGENRRLKRLREWAVRLEMGSLHSVLPHHSGYLGRPGSPVTTPRSDSNIDQQILPQESNGGPISPMPFMIESAGDKYDKGTHSMRVTYKHIQSSQSDNHRKLVKSLGTARNLEKACSILDAEICFLDKLDRSLGWLFNECQPGHRGSKYATLPNNWVNKQKWLVYTAPCCASTEPRQQYRGSQGSVTSVTSCEVFDSHQEDLAKISRRKARAASIASWRAAVNRARYRMNTVGVRSVEFLRASAEEPPRGAIDSANWMLRRPPQGFGTRQKNEYYCGGMGRWAKLEDWQNTDECFNNSNHIWRKSLGLFAESKKSYWSVQQNSAEVICS